MDIIIGGLTDINQLPVFVIMVQHVFEADSPFFTFLAGLPVKYLYPVMILLLFSVYFYLSE